jgi:hypothetical protein
MTRIALLTLTALALCAATAAGADVTKGTRATSYPVVETANKFGAEGITPDFLPSSDLDLEPNTGRPIIYQRVTGGSANDALTRGSVKLSGAYEWRRGSTRARFRSLALDLRRNRVRASVDGKRVTVLALGGVSRRGSAYRAERMKLSGEAARLLARKFDNDVFRGGMVIATELKATIRTP